LPIHIGVQFKEYRMSFALPDNMPPLNLTIPEGRQSVGNVELNDALLQHWVKELPLDNPMAMTERYLDALTRFNSNNVLPKDKLRLLDIYRKPFNDLLFNLTPATLLQKVPDADKRFKLISDMAEVYHELSKGYNSIVMDANKLSNNLKLHPIAHMAIYRALEQLSYQALHAYKFYRSLPINTLREMYQLYVLTESAKIADDVAFVNTSYKADFTVKQRFLQMILVTICDPYGLQAMDVLRCYHLMLQLAMAAKVHLHDQEDTIKAGLFYINCLSDRAPHPAVIPVKSEEDDPLRLILDTKTILVKVGDLFDQQEKVADTHKPNENMILLKQVIPYLNTSYQRKQPRLPVEGKQETFISLGLNTIHEALSDKGPLPDKHHPWLHSSWIVLNKNSYGYLVEKRKSLQAQSLFVGDFIGIFDPLESDEKRTLKMASVRWIRTDQFEQTKVGLKFIEGEAMPVSFTLPDSGNKYPAFLMPENYRTQTPATLITQKGTFKAGQILDIKIRKKKFGFKLKTKSMLEQNQSYERFTFDEIFD
jgi:hypothetical protein